MLERRIDIERYDWMLNIYYAVTQYHAVHIMNDLVRVHCPERIMKRVHTNLKRKTMDTGFTYSNKQLRETVMVIGLHSSPSEFLNSLEHELRHLIDDICSASGIAPRGEEVAYLTGDINQLITPDIQLFMCNCHYKELIRKTKVLR